MGNYFYGSFHWEFEPVADRVALLDALRVFAGANANLFIEVTSPSLMQRFRFWRMRSSYQTTLNTDALYPEPSVFHVALNGRNLQALKMMVKRDGLNQHSITHIKGYAGERGLFWFHGFCDECDQTLCCSKHVEEVTIESLETKLKLKAVKKYGELKSDRERHDEIKRFVKAMRIGERAGE